jgi:hypothetical protein
MFRMVGTRRRRNLSACCARLEVERLNAGGHGGLTFEKGGYVDLSGTIGRHGAALLPLRRRRAAGEFLLHGV